MGSDGRSQPIFKRHGQPAHAWAVLLILTVQNCAAVLVMRYTRSVSTERLYLTSTAVIVGEVMKTITCGLLILREQGARGIADTFAHPTECLKSGVPAVLYLLQNNLQYIAVGSLHAATYLATYQLKILVTALISVWLLHRNLVVHKWIALILLTAGITFVQLAEMDGSVVFSNSDTAINVPVGVAATLAATICSSFAGVYLERLVKADHSTSVWQRNLQLGLYSITIGVAALISSGDAERVRHNGFFHGYTWVTAASITVQALGGIVIAIVIKHADNIQKNFATALSIVLSAVLSTIFLGFAPSFQFAVGLAFVILSIWLFNK